MQQSIGTGSDGFVMAWLPKGLARAHGSVEGWQKSSQPAEVSRSQPAGPAHDSHMDRSSVIHGTHMRLCKALEIVVRLQHTLAAEFVAAVK